LTQAVLIADDHPMCAAALAMATKQVAPGADTVKVGTIAEAVAVAEQRRFDLILLDLMLPDVQGFAGLLMLRRLQPRATVAIVSSTDDPAVMRRAAREGASGYIPKSAPMSAMVGSIRTLMTGGNAFPAEMAQTDSDVVTLPSRIGELSPAQFRVLRAAADGSQNKHIAY
jgi:DNA-binding NarL/FixJ family response regulator